MTEVLVFKLVSIFISIGFVLLALYSKKVVGYWLNPASIFSLFWCLYSFLPLLLAFDDPINPFSVLYILVFNFFFVFSVSLFNWRYAFYLNKKKPRSVDVFNTRFFRVMFVGGACFCILCLMLGILKQGFSLTGMLENPMAVAGGYAKKRYADEIVPSLYSQLGLLSSYVTVVFGGVLYGSLRLGERKFVILLFSFIPSLLVMVLQSAKGLFFFSVFLFVGGVAVARIYDKKYNLIDKSSFKVLIVYALFVFPLLIMSFLSRGLYQESDSSYVIYKLKRYLITYSSGHLYAFSDWFSERYFSDSTMNYNQEYFTTGFYTFMSAFRYFGDDRIVPMGTYSEFYASGDYIFTNIYTMFRGLISDFTLVGSLVVACFAGFVCNFAYYRLLCERLNPFYILFFVFFVAISYQTYLISTLMWKTIPLVFVVQVGVLFIYFKLNASISRKRNVV